MTKQKNTPNLKKIEQLLTSSQALFTTQDLSVIWQVSDKVSLYSSIQYYIRAGKLRRVHKGIYTLAQKEYDSLELAQKLVRPSYISFHTALAIHGINFQLYTTTHSIALKSKQLTVDQEKFAYHQLKDRVFYDSLGLEDKTTYFIAGPERAICDSLYLTPGLSFDILDKIDLDFLHRVSKIYDNQRLEADVDAIVKIEKSK